jgi:antitoxin CptB
MTGIGLTRTSEDLDPRRRRALYRSWHRGTREMDLLLGRYAEVALAGMSDTELDVFEALMEAQDRDVFAWLTGTEETPEAYRSRVFDGLVAFHAANPLV